MIIYNVTVKVDHGIIEDWTNWMRSTHIPDVMNTGHFLEYRFCRLLDQDETDGFTYAIQYLASSRENIEKYWERDAPRLQNEHSERYKERFVAFRTLLEVIDQ